MFAALAASILVSTALALPTQFSGTELGAHKGEKKSSSKGTVVVFLSARCPCSNSHEDLLKSLPARYPQFSFVGIHANADEPVAEAKTHFEKSQFPFPVYQDEKTKWADEFRAFKTPHAFIVSPEGNLLFQGGVTDSHVAANAKKQFLADALEDLAQNRAVKVAEGRTLGCVISRK